MSDSPYGLVVMEGYQCWLVHLTHTNPRRWQVLGRTQTEQEAIELALDIYNGVMASTSSERR
jgi:hypothetical protein